jgi:hypothetical protein
LEKVENKKSKKSVANKKLISIFANSISGNNKKNINK